MLQRPPNNSLTAVNIGSLSEQDYICLEREALGIESGADSDSRRTDVQLHLLEIEEISRRFRNSDTNDVTSEVGDICDVELLNLSIQ